MRTLVPTTLLALLTVGGCAPHEVRVPQASEGNTDMPPPDTVADGGEPSPVDPDLPDAATPAAASDAAVTGAADASSPVVRDAATSPRLDSAAPVAPRDTALPSQPPDAARPPDVAAPLETLVVQAAADSFVRGPGYNYESAADDLDEQINFGSESLLLVRYVPDNGFYWREAFIEFALPARGTVVEAALILSVQSNDAVYENALQVLSLDPDTWSEATVTWATRPTLGDVLGKAAVPAGEASMITVDVTSHVKGKAGRIAFGLTQVPDAAPARIEVAAREAGNIGPRLRLKIQP